MLHRRAFLAFSAATLTEGAAPGHVAIPPGSAFILLRHGDRDGEDLNAKGKARARIGSPLVARRYFGP